MGTQRGKQVRMYHAVTDLRLAERYYEIIKHTDENLARLNILISFNHFRNQLDKLMELKKKKMVASTFLDAGTFGMNSRGSNPGRVNLFQKYLLFIYKYGEHFNYISSFDDRFNEPCHNYLNYENLRRKLKVYDAIHHTTLERKLVPVIHSPDKEEYESYEMTPAEEFQSYADAGAKTIGIGSSPVIGPQGMEELKELREEYGIRVHRFGNFDFEFIREYEIESADSGRYFRSTQYGRDAWFWDDDMNDLVRVAIRTKVLLPKYKEMLKRVFGWDWNDLLSKYDRIWMVNLYAHQQAQQFLTEKFAI